VLFLAVVGFSVWAGASAREDAIREASSEAELAAQTELTPLLQARDLTTPITGDRAREIAAGIDRTIVSVSSIDEVRIFSSLGRILYADDPKFVGTRPSYLRELTFEVAGGRSQMTIRQGLLQTYVPIWMNPGGDVAVAELSQPVGPIAATATADWIRLALIAGALALGGIAMMVVTSRTPATRSAPVQLYAPAIPRRAALGESADADSPLYQQAGFRELEEQRRDAERRASAVEENFHAVQKRLKDALEQVKELEGRLAMNETQNSTNGTELHELRDQLRDTSERLHKAELDNNALRERMSLRQQELDESRRILAEVRRQTDADELRSRIAAAGELAERMERQIEELEAELRAGTRSSTTRVSEGIRDFEDADLEIEEEDDLFEHPVIIRNAPGHSTSHSRVW
jgi:hypothetical protein